MTEYEKDRLSDLVKEEGLEALGYHDPTLGPAPPSDMNGLMEEMIFHKEFKFRYEPCFGEDYKCSLSKTYKDRIDEVRYQGYLDEDFLKWLQDALRVLNKHEV